MSENKTFFDWEDNFDSIANIKTDIYVNDSLQLNDFDFKTIDILRNDSGTLNIKFFSKDPFHSSLIKGIRQTWNLKIEFKIKSGSISNYDSLVIYGGNFNGETRFYVDEHVETKLIAKKVVFNSNRNKKILREWYGCNNTLDFFKGFSTSKVIQETITYKNQNKVVFTINNKSESISTRSFWVKMETYKFKVTALRKKYNEEYYKYVIEYNQEWGGIPEDNIRYDISSFMSFIIGTKLIKFGESCFDNKNISSKEYISPSPIDVSFLYQTNFPFYNHDYRQNDTEKVIKQISKMLKEYLLIKDKYRLNEVLPSLYIKSYLNFNFINYVTYIEMFSNIEIGEKPLIISKSEFKVVLKKLNKVKGIPKELSNKFQNLNVIGIGKKIQRLLLKYKIDYNEYKDVFTVRGKVVHGTKVDIEEMYKASEKAKELLTILTLKKINYNGYIRDFLNDNELIFLKNMSRLSI